MRTKHLIFLAGLVLLVGCGGGGTGFRALESVPVVPPVAPPVVPPVVPPVIVDPVDSPITPPANSQVPVTPVTVPPPPVPPITPPRTPPATAAPRVALDHQELGEWAGTELGLNIDIGGNHDGTPAFIVRHPGYFQGPLAADWWNVRVIRWAGGKETLDASVSGSVAGWSAIRNKRQTGTLHIQFNDVYAEYVGPQNVPADPLTPPTEPAGGFRFQVYFTGIPGLEFTNGTMSYNGIWKLSNHTGDQVFSGYLIGDSNKAAGIIDWPDTFHGAWEASK